MPQVSQAQGFTLLGMLAVLVAATTYKTARGTLTSGVVVKVGETISGGKTEAPVPIVLPAGPAQSGKTYWPIRGLKFPHATVFLDSQYFKGYPDKNGRVTEPKLKGYWHTGTDMNGPGACCADQGDPLYAVRDGVIEYVGIGSGSWGLLIVERVLVDGRPYWVRYAHCQTKGKNGQTVTVKKGQVVKAGQIIGHIGRGNWPCAHLHLDVFHTMPPSWNFWPGLNAAPTTVTAYCTDPDAWLRRLKAVAP